MRLFRLRRLRLADHSWFAFLLLGAASLLYESALSGNTFGRVAARSGAAESSIASCSEESAPSFELSATDKDFGLYFPSYLANGYFTTTTSVHGTDPTLSLMANLMDYTTGDVSRPAAIPSWAEINYFDGKSFLNDAPISSVALADYRQTLRMNDGLLTTRYSWADGDRTTAVSICTFVSEHSPHLALTRMTLAPDFNGPITLHFTLRPELASARRFTLARLTKEELKKVLGLPTEGLLSSLKPTSLTAANRESIWYPGEVRITSFGGNQADRVIWISGRAVNGSTMTEAAAVTLSPGFVPKAVNVRASADLVDLEVSGDIQKGQSYSFAKYVAVSREGWREGSEIESVKAARSAGFASLLANHRAAWRNLWKSDVTVDGNPQLQKAIHSDLFYLLQNSTPDTDIPMMACGLSPNYYGHVFWDNDSWDFPVMLLLHPDRAKSLVMFRYHTLSAAQARAREQGFKGGMFPWESDPQTGTEVTPYYARANAAREVHVNGDVAVAQWQYYLSTGDKEWLKHYGFPVMRDTAEFWKSRVTYNRGKDRYEILHVTSTDEAYDDVPNDSFTNAVAQKALRATSAAARILKLSPDPEWDRIADKMYIPVSGQLQRHLVFDESVPHNKKTWGVSNVVLLSLPALDLPMIDQVRHNDFESALNNFKALTTGANQNGLFVSMFPIAAATLDLPNESSEWIERNLGSFLKPPFNVRSETALNNTTYILATSSGFLQDFLYGFTGLRFTEQGLNPVYAPVLPPSWKSITIRGIYVSGGRYDFALSRNASGAVSMRKMAE